MADGTRPALVAPWLAAVAMLIAVAGALYLVRRIADLDGRVTSLEQRIATARGEPGGSAPAPASEGGPSATPSTPPQPACAGVIAPSLVRTAVGTFGEGVFACYRALRADRSDAAGTLVVELRVDDRGAVEAAAFSGTLDEPRLEACVRQDVAAWRFPPPAGGSCARVRVPFALSPASLERLDAQDP